MREEHDRVMATVVGLAADPGAAVEPASPTAFGRAGHGVANGLGTIGEAIDGSRWAGGPQGPAVRRSGVGGAGRPRAAAARRAAASRAA